MLLFTRYTFEHVALGYVLGAVSVIVVLALMGWLIEKADEYKELKKLKDKLKNQPEVIDADFVEKPRTQLNSSQALVRRSTSLTTNRDSRLTKR